MTKPLIDYLSHKNMNFTILENGISKLWNTSGLESSNRHFIRFSDTSRYIKNFVQSFPISTFKNASDDVYPYWSYWPYRSTNYLKYGYKKKIF